MRRFLRAIGRGLEAIAYSFVCLLACLSLGTIGFTVAVYLNFDISALTWKFGLVEVGVVILSALLYWVLSIIFLLISQWIEWHV